MVHPHIRGAYCGFHLPQCLFCGSSPHTWGIQLRQRWGRLEHRFIPTYVGHTCPLELLARPIFGSSPPTWGIQMYSFHILAPLSVHPHIRGAYSVRGRETVIPRGSSPHTWGILSAARNAATKSRFIPTYVGHTSRNRFAVLFASVHPHIRGAYCSISQTVPCSHGSSPHTWGILSVVPSVLNRGRFIPTYVGHTLSRYLSRLCKSVHPHIRGAYSKLHEKPSCSNGSSPHTWGILNTQWVRSRCSRFIPTYVGHTSSQSIPHGLPRGSSPHTWGIRSPRR